jgi:hypothetical protein
MSSSSGLLVSRERQMAESLGLEETEYSPQDGDEIECVPTSITCYNTYDSQI